MTGLIINANWRDSIRPGELEHWERVWAREQAVADRAVADGVTYRYIPWYDARNDRSLIGAKATSAYWVSGFGALPWGHQHAHTYKGAFETVVNIGADFMALESYGSRHMISYDTICVQERAA